MQTVTTSDAEFRTCPGPYLPAQSLNTGTILLGYVKGQITKGSCHLPWFEPSPPSPYIKHLEMKAALAEARPNPLLYSPLQIPFSCLTRPSPNHLHLPGATAYDSGGTERSSSTLTQAHPRGPQRRCQGRGDWTDPHQCLVDGPCPGPGLISCRTKNREWSNPRPEFGLHHTNIWFSAFFLFSFFLFLWRFVYAC